MELYPHQEELIGFVMGAAEGGARSVLVREATGLGGVRSLIEAASRRSGRTLAVLDSAVADHFAEEAERSGRGTDVVTVSWWGLRRGPDPDFSGYGTVVLGDRRPLDDVTRDRIARIIEETVPEVLVIEEGTYPEHRNSGRYDVVLDRGRDGRVVIVMPDASASGQPFDR